MSEVKIFEMPLVHAIGIISILKQCLKSSSMDDQSRISMNQFWKNIQRQITKPEDIEFLKETLKENGVEYNELS